MKSILSLLIFLFNSYFVSSQTQCYIYYNYDQAGNRIKRYYFCGSESLKKAEEPMFKNVLKYFQTNIQNSKINSLTEEIYLDNNSINYLVFPNPSNGIFNLKDFNSNLDAKIILTDLNGKIIIHRLLNESRQVDISDFKDGVYILAILDGLSFRAIKLTKFSY